MEERSLVQSTLAKIGAIDPHRVTLFADRTRDREVPVWHDPATEVIFIDGFFVGNNEYEQGTYREHTAFARFEDNADTQRRVKQFRHLYSERTVLDFGCGSGSFLRGIKTFARRIQGVELQRSFRDSLNAEGIECFAALSDCETPEVTFMFHVLEHLPDPLSSLIALRRMTSASDGVLVVEVPNARDFLISHANNQAFISFTLWSQHLILHTRQSLDLLLRAAGFTQVEVFGVQRYGLANHLRWLINGLPGGHREAFASFETPALCEAYEAALARIDATDTLIAIAH